MKIIEGMKRLKDLDGKAKDLREKIKRYSADASFETPAYPDQSAQITGWLQSHRDTLFEIETLNFRISKTNALTSVTVSLEEGNITKSITQWILRRRKLAEAEKQSWECLTDRGIKEGFTSGPSGQLHVTCRKYYDQETRDKKVEQFRSEPHKIDAALEIVNATTDLME